MSKFDHTKLEAKWRKSWEDQDIYKTPEDVTSKTKKYILPQLPYPSGAGLHMGHSEIYVACDIFARYNRMIGNDVLQVIGWDSFGLPAENYAIKTNTHPRISTEKAVSNFKEQIQSLGVSIDWDRSVGSHEPGYYKWTQWFFLLMLEQGLAYRKKQSVNWCDTDKTVLANAQVEDGKCERCGNQVVQKEMEQWFFKITDYADRLYDDLDKVDWPTETVKRQRDWIGRSQGAEISFQVRIPGSEADGLGELKVFTTRPDTLFGATFMVIAPEHPLIKQLQDSDSINNDEEVEVYIKKAKLKSELDRQQQKYKSGVVIDGVTAVNPVTDEEIPIYIADYVLIGYGTGAIMAVPAHDERDFEFANRFGLEKRVVINPVDTSDFRLTKAYKESPENITPSATVVGDVLVMQGDESAIQAIESYIQGQNEGKVIFSGQSGVLVNSGFLDGMKAEEAKEAIISWLVEQGVGESKKTFKLRDWSISRQRFWGSPIPILYDQDGSPHPVPKEDLPVILPDDVDFKPTGESPLNYSESFHEGVEEKYGKGWRREVDTLDTFMCSSWYFFRYIDAHNEDAFASEEALKTWMPVDFYLGGPEHVNGHLLYSRFFTKVLFDAGYIDFDEPFKIHKHQGLVLGPDGRKMSKRWGNTINPTDVVKQFGADAGRMYLMFMGPLEQDKTWNDSAANGVRRFIQRVYDFKPTATESSEEVKIAVTKLVAKVTNDIPELKFNTAVAEFMKVINLIEPIPDQVSKEDWEKFLTVLSPITPFVTEDIWARLGNKNSIHLESWPEYDESLLSGGETQVAVQINGKTRDTIMLPAEVTEEMAVDAAKARGKVNSHISGKEIVKVIYVPGRIINLVVK